MEDKDVVLHFGAMAPPITDQLKTQGLLLTQEKEKFFEHIRSSINMLRIYGYMRDVEANRMYKKLFKQITEKCQEEA